MNMKCYTNADLSKLVPKASTGEDMRGPLNVFWTFLRKIICFWCFLGKYYVLLLPWKILPSPGKKPAVAHGHAYSLIPSFIPLKTCDHMIGHFLPL